MYDIAIVGGGFAGCMFFAALKHTHPHLKTVLIERNQTLGGNHTWCFHNHDVPRGVGAWLGPLISKSWDSYEVQFPNYSRVMGSAYHSVRSHDLHEKLIKHHAKEIRLNTEVKSWKADEETHGFQWVILSTGEKLKVHTVVDARGWIYEFPPGDVAYQKFVGLDLKLKKPHGLSHVVLKDVTQPQIDGYRFFYLLPWSETEILIEDTYYSNHSILKDDRIEQEVLKYAQQKGWEVERVLRKEVGCLPLSLYPLAGAKPKGAGLGAASLFFHPVTGYTTPQTLMAIDRIVSRAALTEESLARVMTELRQEFAPQEKYLRLLNRMMFLAAAPATRYKILERFYRLSKDLIDRFYSGQVTAADQIRILVGKPPVSILKALKVLRDHKPKSPPSTAVRP